MFWRVILRTLDVGKLSDVAIECRHRDVDELWIFRLSARQQLEWDEDHRVTRLVTFPTYLIDVIGSHDERTFFPYRTSKQILKCSSIYDVCNLIMFVLFSHVQPAIRSDHQFEIFPSSQSHPVQSPPEFLHVVCSPHSRGIRMVQSTNS